MTIKFSLNDKAHEVNVPEDMPILWVVRDVLGHTGTKYGCGAALCGACTVHLDGEAIRSCVTPISAAAGRKLTTIEGLSDNGHHPLQVAWVDMKVPQCGFCQAGQIMSAAALLQRTSHPTDGEIDEALAGNLCRCGTYNRIKDAVKHVAAAKRQGGSSK